MNLRRVAYDPDSDISAVRECLRRKREVAAKDGINGIGPTSCCSYIEYEKNGRIENIFGSSRLRVPYRVKGTDIATAAVHAELSALWNLLEDFDGTLPVIRAFYIEMEPCGERCHEALLNILPANQEVMFSFHHPGDRADWEAKAKMLCRPVAR